jgi:hypothetical protein
MEMEYSCPRCSAHLNPGPRIILLGRHKNERGLFAFNPEPGNYDSDLPSNVSIHPGEVWEFLCPACNGALSLAGEEGLAALDMRDGVGNYYKVVFSTVAGEQATFVISQDSDVEVQEFGVNFTKYDNCLWEKYI